MLATVNTCPVDRDAEPMAPRRERSLIGLLEQLASAVNRAERPEQALHACLELIARFGNWAVGHVGIPVPGCGRYTIETSIWHIRGGGDYEELIDLSNRHDYHGRRFVGTCLASRRPVWISDLAAGTPGPRMTLALRAGLRSAFVFPIVVGSEVAAFIEFFADDAREPDTRFLDALVTVAAQIARAIERDRAERALRESREKLENMLSSLPDIVYSCEAVTQRVIYVNQAVETVTGYAPAAFMTDPKLWCTITHPCDRERVEAGLATLMQKGAIETEFRIVRLDGSVRIVSHSARLVRDPAGAPLRIDGIATDVTERRFAEARVDYLTRHDRITNLPNRSLFRERLEHALARAQRREDRVAVLIIDLDHFRDINDELGHAAGDELLRLAARRIEAGLREADTLARLDGDDFGIMLDGVSEAEELHAIGEKIVNLFTNAFAVNGHDVYLTVSVGMNAHPPGPHTADGLIRSAEIAVLQAKRDGGNCCRLHEPQGGEQRRRIVDLRTRLRRALDNGELVLHYQPKVSLATGAVTGAEALVRWNHPELGQISPAQFIPLAEHSGLIIPIGDWVLRTACAQARDWHAAGYPIEIAVNLSPRQFRQRDLVANVGTILRETDLRAGALELEVTESTAMTQPEQAIGVMNALCALGVRLAVDDFGTGYSSLAYLKRFPLHRLKIDRAFLQDLSPGSHDIAIGKTIVSLARCLKLATTVEGVENRAQHDLMAMLGCNEYQGYYFSRPLPAAEFTALIENSAVVKTYMLAHAQRSQVADIQLLEPSLSSMHGAVSEALPV